MNRYKTLIGLNTSAFLLMSGVGMIVALLPQKIMTLTNSIAMTGYLAAAFAVTYVLTQIPIGRLADKIGFKPLLTLGYGLCGFIGLLYYWADTPTLIFLGRALQGVAEVPIWALAPALLSLQYAHKKGKVMGIYNASFHLGLSIGPLLGLLLAQLATQEDIAFLFYAGVSFASSLIIVAFVQDPRQRTAVNGEPFHFRHLLPLITSRLTQVVLLGIALYGAGYGLAVSIIPAFLFSAKGFSQLSISVYFSLFYIAVSLSQLVIGPISDRRGRQGFMVWGLILTAVGLALFPPRQQPWIYLPLAIFSLGLGIFCVSSLAYLNECVPDSFKGTISGAYYLFWGLGYFLGPLLLGKAGNAIGFNTSFYLLVVMLGVVIILLFLGSSQMNRAWGQWAQQPLHKE